MTRRADRAQVASAPPVDEAAIRDVVAALRMAASLARGSYEHPSDGDPDFRETWMARNRREMAGLPTSASWWAATIRDAYPRLEAAAMLLRAAGMTTAEQCSVDDRFFAPSAVECLGLVCGTLLRPRPPEIHQSRHYYRNVALSDSGLDRLEARAAWEVQQLSQANRRDEDGAGEPRRGWRDVLRVLRENAGLSDTAVAKNAGVSRTSLYEMKFNLDGDVLTYGELRALIRCHAPIRGRHDGVDAVDDRRPDGSRARPPAKRRK